MSLQEDINKGLIAISRSPDKALKLDNEGRVVIPVPMPANLIKLEGGVLNVEVVISDTESFFTMATPLAFLSKTPSAGFLEALFYRQAYADQVSAASFAISTHGERDTLMGVYHWMLESITAEQFSELFQSFVAASFDLIDEVKESSKKDRAVRPIHKGRPDY